MRVEQKEVSQECIDKILARMKEKPFKAGDLAPIAQEFGICKLRLPDRIIQQQKKLGNIHLLGGVWHWVHCPVYK